MDKKKITKKEYQDKLLIEWAEQFIKLIESNGFLLQENLRLMKENAELREK